MIDLIVQVTRLVKSYNGPINGQTVGNMFYGLQGMNCDCPGVVALFIELTRLIESCEGSMSEQEVSNMLYGLQRFKSSHPAVQSCLLKLAPLVQTCTEQLSAEELTNSFIGFLKLFDPSDPHIVSIFRFLQSQYDKAIRSNLTVDDARKLTRSLCLFAHFQEKKGISDEWMAEITAMKSRLDRFEQFGLIDGAASDVHHSKIQSKPSSIIERVYVEEFRRQLKNTDVTVMHRAWIDGIECNIIIIRKSNSSSSTSSSSTGNIEANIEIDGPHHKQPHKLYFTSLRDHYFQHHYGFPVLRQDVSGRMKKGDEVKEDVRRILKGLGIMKKE